MTDYQKASDEVALEMQQNLVEAPPQDTLDRALWRVDTVLNGFYDGSHNEPETALKDLLTDLMHWSRAHEVDLYEAADGAAWMVDQERGDWGLDSLIGSHRESPNTDSRAGSSES